MTFDVYRTFKVISVGHVAQDAALIAARDAGRDRCEAYPQPVLLPQLEHV